MLRYWKLHLMVLLFVSEAVEQLMRTHQPHQAWKILHHWDSNKSCTACEEFKNELKTSHLHYLHFTGCFTCLSRSSLNVIAFKLPCRKQPLNFKLNTARVEPWQIKQPDAVWFVRLCVYLRRRWALLTPSQLYRTRRISSFHSVSHSS